MLLGYNTNGMAHHDPLEAIELLAQIGYRAVAITIDHGVLNPRATNLGDQAGRIRRLSAKHGMAVVIETGARYLLDPWKKHEPTLVSADKDRRSVRTAFYVQALETAVELRAECVSIWSGVVHDSTTDDEAFDRLKSALAPVLQAADRLRMPVAFEPEPGMLIDTLARYDELKQRLTVDGVSCESLRLTADIGHLHCLGETPIGEALTRHQDDLANVHIEDMRAGVHEHLPFGEGEIDFPVVIQSLEEMEYDGPLCVELSRHSHEAPVAAQRAYDFLSPLIG